MFSTVDIDTADIDTAEPLARSVRGEGLAPARARRHPVKDAVLTLAGFCGLLCLVWLAASLAFGVSIVIFMTGSMAPTAPTGSGALVRSIAAADIKVGDVVTVQRVGTRLPVTHRVVSIAPDPDDAASRMLVLRGDANEVSDPFPYQVTEAKLVMVTIPGLGTLLVAARTPLVMGVLTLLVAALVLWAFWPSRTPLHRAEARLG